MSAQDSEYAVGHGKPPVHTRFEPGRSGNPNGRPKARESFGQLARRVFNQPVVIYENGKPRTITKQECVLKQLANKAAAGESRAIGEVIKLQQIAQQHPANDNRLIIGLIEF